MGLSRRLNARAWNSHHQFMLTQRLRISARLGALWLVRVLCLLVERVTLGLGSRRVLFIFLFAYHASYRLAYLLFACFVGPYLLLPTKAVFRISGNSS